jgi:hypothetical protein
MPELLGPDFGQGSWRPVVVAVFVIFGLVWRRRRRGKSSSNR